MAYDLSVIITARNEEFLPLTVDGLLEKKRGNTEVIVVSDGGWPKLPVKDHPDVTMIQYHESIGQRAAINQAASLSKAKYIMKLDAHCMMDEGFDVKLMADCDEDWIVVPRLYNLHAFNWHCNICGHTKYQGPTPTECEKCHDPKSREDGGIERVMVWQPRWGRKSDFMRFDSDLHFQYWGELGKRPESQGDIADTMSLLGACFFMHRKRYWDLGGSDEQHGSWGQQGTEIACKAWLSGGRLVVNKKTWYSHLFRTQGGDFGFPYPISGRQVDNARKHSKDMWLNNKWDKQVRPLSWLVEKFYPVPGWTDEDLNKLREKTATFKPVVTSQTLRSVAGSTNPMAGNTGISEGMTSFTNNLSGVIGSNTSTSENIISLQNETQMSRVTAPNVVANDMVKNHDILSNSSLQMPGYRSDQPGIHETVGSISNTINRDHSIPPFIGGTIPNPTAGVSIDSNFREQTSDINRTNIGDCEKFSHVNSKGIIFYTDCQLNLRIAHKVQRNLRRISESKNIPIVSASLKPMSFGKNVVLPLKRGVLTMFKQILAALEASDADIVYFTEHDCLYHPSHFDFTPLKKDVWYYNTNVWKVDTTGRALHYDCKQVSGICVYRETAIKHYRKRVEMVEKQGYSSRMGYEPGTHNRPERVDDATSEAWQSTYPNIDIRHNNNLSPTRWTKEEFRNQKNTQGWTEGTVKDIPGWSEITLP
jgi:glycosyltransferase involved in cell wall biosynthesis